MLAGSTVGLIAYFAIAPYCSALLSAAVSAVIMAAWTHLQPENFDWRTLTEENILDRLFCDRTLLLSSAIRCRFCRHYGCMDSLAAGKL